ncbi:AGE family epimerase/isomerase [Catenovulum sp. 2E275]|uniref:AGE family epimerase/isomerase n=1 Tax=Catenovulum sp. 2E275 TaxID=2980497 RepID=UPI0021D3CAF3|nr:AGE family epimerase/isomerase [Catenovulum sp. 2E275]MCU4675960.1 AGE family epimerase/isomerase [Catenovulum sp. 2E275]
MTVFRQTENQASVDALVGEFKNELIAIADWWVKHAIDQQNGGFYGQVNADGTVDPTADKGIVLNARILWFFSEVCHYLDDPAYKMAADRAYQYIVEHFNDPLYGGVFWSVNADGTMKDSKKQTYAQSFTIYGLSAYYKLTGNKEAIELAYQYFECVQQYCHDEVKGGYLEAFDRQWAEITDMRLSEKDDNLPKTQNTHLHVMEAFATLHHAKPTLASADAVKRLLGYFKDKIINPTNYHLRLFMDKDWQDHSKSFSYGHDIECSWLMFEALLSLDDTELTQQMTPLVLAMANTSLIEGIGEHGQVCDEFEFENQHKHQEGCWWVQAEAMVGFLYAYHISGEQKYWQAFLQVWQYTKAYHIDTELGEWHWIATIDQDPNNPIYKAGFWKGPYHNGRAMMEVIKVLTGQLEVH